MAEERSAWASKYGFAVEKALWPGMYAPHIESRLYLVSSLEHGVPVQPLLSALSEMPHPIQVENWSGQTLPYVPPFISPGSMQLHEEAKARASKPKAPRKSTTPATPRASVAYSGLITGIQRRPKGKMSLETHKEVGALLCKVLAVSYHRKGVENKVGEVRNELDNWVQREYGDHELSLEQLNGLYYPHIDRVYPKVLSAELKEEKMACLLKARSVLEENYPACRPLQKLMTKLDQAMRSLSGWGAEA